MDTRITDDAENSLIGSVIADPAKIDAVAEACTLTRDDFKNSDLGEVWHRVVEMHDSGGNVDVVRLVRSLRGCKKASDKSWAALIGDAVHTVPNASHARYYALQVKQDSQRRQLSAIGLCVSGMASDELQDPGNIAEGMISQLESIACPSESTVLEPKTWLHRWQDMLETRMDQKEGTVRTGYHTLDQMLAGGLRNGEMCVIAGRPGCGKTAFACGIASNVAKTMPVLFVSMEMSAIELADRILSRESRIELYRMHSGTVGRSDQQKLVETAAELAERRLSIVDSECHLARIAPLIRQWRRKCGEPGLVVIDYMQLLELDQQRGQSRQDVVATISRRLKQLAKAIESPIIVLSQLNRQADGVRPRLSHLRESGSIEQDANQVILLWSEDQSTGDTLIKGCLEKSRNGATGELNLVFFKKIVSMEEAAPERYSEFDHFNEQPQDPSAWDNEHFA